MGDAKFPDVASDMAVCIDASKDGGLLLNIMCFGSLDVDSWKVTLCDMKWRYPEVISVCNLVCFPSL